MMNTAPLPQPSYDLHSHSTASDGAYTPAELVKRAASAGITSLALTDHDTTAGLQEASAWATAAAITLIPGVEISVTWQSKTLHLVGLDINPEDESLQAILFKLQTIREERSEEMGRRLSKAGVHGILEEARTMAGNGMITRTHFARAIAGRGLAADVRDVFNRYLTHGKPGYVSTQWADMGDAIDGIRKAGGVAVLAHPQRYSLTKSWLRRLLTEFRERGGEGIEVLSGSCPPGDVQSNTELARRFDLLASCGSDFHGPDESWPKLGHLPAIPAGLVPVWTKWTPFAAGAA